MHAAGIIRKQIVVEFGRVIDNKNTLLTIWSTLPILEVDIAPFLSLNVLELVGSTAIHMHMQEATLSQQCTVQDL